MPMNRRELEPTWNQETKGAATRWLDPARVPRSCPRSERTPPAPHPGQLCRYYHRPRTHPALDKDAPNGRPIELSEVTRIVAIPEVGGLHHRYVRQAA